MNDVKDLQKGITDILVAIGKIETEIKQLSSMSVKVEQNTLAIARLEQSAKSAHLRIDELERELDNLAKRYEDDKKYAREDRKWLWGAAVGAIALLITLYKTIKGA